MKHVLIYEAFMPHPVRPYIIGIAHDTKEEAEQRMRECLDRGMREEHLRIVHGDSDEAKMLKNSKHLF